MSRVQRTRARIAIVAITGITAAAVGSVALAGHIGSGVKSYTGCLSSGDGVIVKVKEGDSPKSACSSGQTQVHLSGGDITKVSVTGALTGGGDNGDVTISLKPEFTLPSGCTTGRIAEWNGTAWVCGVDNDTTYTEGTGLDLTGTTFSIQPDYRVKNNPDCESGKFATGFDGSNGTIQCTAPPAPTSAGIEVWQKKFEGGLGESINLPDGEGVDLVTMPLPAGTFLITAVATVRDAVGGSSDDEVQASCRLRNGAFVALPVGDGYVDIGQGQSTPGVTTVVHGLLSFASSDTVRFTCFGTGDDNKADNVTLTAVKVGVVHTP